MIHQLFFAIVLVASAHAHLTTVCTSTAPSEPGFAYFWLGTYHTFSSAPAGMVIITTPDGSENSFAFTEKCGVSSSASSGTAEADLKAGAACGIPSDAMVTCYGDTPFPTTTGSYSSVSTYIKARVPAQTGPYQMRTEGTDMNFDPCPSSYGSHPCTAGAAGSAVSIALAVAGAGASCSAAPPAISNTEPIDCSGSDFDGAVCNVKCLAGHVKSGVLNCNDGAWVNSVTCAPPPAPPVAAAAAPVLVQGDPHFLTAHGDRFDFKGKHSTTYNLLSHANTSLNALFENVDYREAGQKHRLVHGSYMRAAYTTFAGASGKVVRIEYAAKAAAYVSYGLVDVSGEDIEEHRVRLTGGWATKLDGCALAFDGRTLSITTPEWAIALHNKVKPGIIGASTCAMGKCFLEVSLTPRFDADHAKVAPHGLIGQSYDGDDLGVLGKTDSYATRGNEVTTHAMGEGAIEGVAADYEMPSKWATAFKFGRFGLKAAPPRDPSALSGEKVKRVDGARVIAQ